MFIPQNYFACKNTGVNSIKPSICGNLVPHIWYHKLLLRPCGKSDTTAIAILAKLLFLYRYNGNTEFCYSFKLLAEKFNLGVNQVKNAIICLESNYLVSHCPKTIVIEGRTFVNEMFLVLNVDHILNITNCDSDFIFANTVNNNPHTTCRNNLGECVEISSPDIDKKDLKEISRSSESNFCKTYSRKVRAEDQNSQSCASSLNSTTELHVDNCIQKAGKSVIKPLNKALGKLLSEFMPLCKEDISFLQIRSGRECDSNFINQLMLKVSRKYSNCFFYNKKLVLSYVVKLLTFELRDAVQVSNGNFTFVVNQDLVKKEQESYLAEVEESCDTSYEAQLSKKIAGIFSRELTYGLLHARSVLVKSRKQDRKESLEKNPKGYKKLLCQEGTLEIYTSQLVKTLSNISSIVAGTTYGTALQE